MSDTGAQMELFFPAVLTPRGDGTFLAKPGKPIVLEPEITVKAACKLLRCEKSTIFRYLDEGKLTKARQAVKRGRVWLIRAEVMALKDRQRGEVA